MSFFENETKVEALVAFIYKLSETKEQKRHRIRFLEGHAFELMQREDLTYEEHNRLMSIMLQLSEAIEIDYRSEFFSCYLVDRMKVHINN